MTPISINLWLGIVLGMLLAMFLLCKGPHPRRLLLTLLAAFTFGAIISKSFVHVSGPGCIIRGTNVVNVPESIWTKSSWRRATENAIFVDRMPKKILVGAFKGNWYYVKVGITNTSDEIIFWKSVKPIRLDSPAPEVLLSAVVREAFFRSSTNAAANLVLDQGAFTGRLKKSGITVLE